MAINRRHGSIISEIKTNNVWIFTVHLSANLYSSLVLSLLQNVFVLVSKLDLMSTSLLSFISFTSTYSSLAALYYTCSKGDTCARPNNMAKVQQLPTYHPDVLCSTSCSLALQLANGHCKDRRASGLAKRKHKGLCVHTHVLYIGLARACSCLKPCPTTNLIQLINSLLRHITTTR